MILSDVSIKRPVFATILNVVIIVFGLFSLPNLPIELYPNVDFPVVSVLVTWPGAAPESVEAQILEPLERAVNGISGLDKVRSTAFPSAALIVLQFKLEKNSDEAAQDTRDKVFSALGQLPTDIETPIIQRFEMGSTPIINVALSAKDVPLGKLSKIADDIIRARLQRVDGVAKVELSGDRKREMHVLIDRNRLSSLNLSASDIVNSVKYQNLDVPAGKIETEQFYWPVRVLKQIKSTQDLSLLPVIGLGRNYSTIGDIAHVEDTLAEETTAAYENQNPTILLSIFKQAGGNTTTIADNLQSTIKKLSAELPKNITLNVVTDDSKFIRGSIGAVKLDLFFGALLAVLIVWIFLRDRKATLISALALPTAVIGTFAFLRIMDFTLNMMSTLGLSLSIGILIDDAIVVIENIYRHLAMGKDAKTAAKDGTAEIGLAVFATTLTICAVFVPVAFMEGIIGRFFYQFGLTVAFAVLISLFVAFTLTPMLSSRWLTNTNHAKRGDRIERALDWMDTKYIHILSLALHHRWKTILIGTGSFVFSLFLLGFIPMSFFPNEDRSQFAIDFTLPENTNITPTKIKALQIAEFLKKYPGVQSVVSQIGNTTNKKLNTAQLSVILLPKEKRNYSQQDIMQRVREDLKPFFTEPGSEFNVGKLEGGGGGPTQTIQLVFLSDNREKLTAFTDQVADFLKKDIAGAVDVTTTKAKPQLEYNLDLGLLRASDLSLNPGLLAANSRILFEGEKTGQFVDEGDRYDIRVKLQSSDKQSPGDITAISSFAAVGSVQAGNAPASIERFNGQQQITVLANYTKSDLSVVTEKIQSYVTQHAPPEVSLVLEGEAELMKDSISSMMQALMLAVLLIYMILCAQYERYIAPFVIMMALPLSFTGAFGALLIFGEHISIYTMIGLILLMGIVTKNGILLIDFTLHHMEKGLSVNEALMEAAPIRLRPILMTTFAASFGMLPVAIGHGEGGEAKSSMGIAVIGGLVMSTLLTLIVIPCLFSLMERKKNNLAETSV
jgi:HAE1 family hydrophobic/amphiphilic exporter-1